MHDSLPGEIVLQDLAEGRSGGKHHVPDDRATLGFLRGVLESCIRVFDERLAEPDAYIDCAVHMRPQSLGLNALLVEQNIGRALEVAERAAVLE